MKEGALIVGSYLLGSIPFALILGRVFLRVDVRKIGSRNIGATNLARVNKPLGVIALLLDAMKGFLVVLLARVMDFSPLVIAGCGFLAFIGHLFPLWLNFKGGKGVATGFGVFLGITPIGAALSLIVWVVVFALTRISSIGSLSAAIALLICVIIFSGNTVFVTLTCLMVALVYIKHLPNIKRIVRGEEKKV